MAISTHNDSEKSAQIERLSVVLSALIIVCAMLILGGMALVTSRLPGAMILIWGFPVIALVEIAMVWVRFHGELQGYFSQAMAAALFTPINIVLLGALLLWITPLCAMSRSGK